MQEAPSQSTEATTADVLNRILAPEPPKSVTLSVVVGGTIALGEAMFKIVSAGNKSIVLQALPGVSVRVIKAEEAERMKRAAEFRNRAPKVVE